MSDRLTHHPEFITNPPSRPGVPPCSPAIRNPQSETRNGFSLVELMVVIALIVIAVAIALPSISRLFSAGADTQAFNLLAAQCAAARAQAIQNATYAGVHVQMSNRSDLEGCYGAVMWDDPSTTDHNLSLSPDHEPQKFPGSYAFGQLSDPFLNQTGGSKAYSITAFDGDTPGAIEDFLTFTIVFNAEGQVSKYIDNDDITLAKGNLIKNGSIDETSSSDDNFLWEEPSDNGNEAGVTAVTLVDYPTFISLTDRNDRDDYLEETAQFMALNYYTGQFFFRY